MVSTATAARLTDDLGREHARQYVTDLLDNLALLGGPEPTDEQRAKALAWVDTAPVAELASVFEDVT